MIGNLSIGQMRSTVVFLTNTPTIAATTDREAVTTGGLNDVYTTLLTTRGRLRKKSGSRGLDLGLVEDKQYYELICRFQSAINTGLEVNGKVLVDSVLYTIQTWEVIDQIAHLYKFELACQNPVGVVINLGAELITNGGFIGNATGWTFGSGWSYSASSIRYGPLAPQIPTLLYQLGTLDETKTYRVSFNVSNGNGFVAVYIGAKPAAAFKGDVGDVTLDSAWLTDVASIVFLPTADFNGTITNVSIKEIL